MTVYSKVRYDYQNDERILETKRKNQYIMFPVPIAFLNDELKAKLGMKTKKEEEEDEVKFCSLNVPIYAADKNTYTIKICNYDMGLPEDFLT
jgi:hypothetical protein